MFNFCLKNNNNNKMPLSLDNKMIWWGYFIYVNATLSYNGQAWVCSWAEENMLMLKVNKILHYKCMWL